MNALLTVLGTLCSSLLLAQPAGAPAVAAHDAPAAAAPVVKYDVEDAAYLIGKEIRCPVCQGTPIADSPAEMAQNMMGQVRRMLGEGKGREEILAFFVASYGEWVLLRPKPKGVNWLVWVLPPLGLLLGFWIIGRAIGGRQAAGGAKAAGSEAPPQADASGEDEYLKMVRDEVQR